jgi:glycosyltransferase involved in cell wall biosynthesis
MQDSFNIDPYPGEPKILFIGLAESTHTISWIDLLDQSELNVRLFALPSGLPPEDWPVRTYVTLDTILELDRRTRARLYPARRPSRAERLLRRYVSQFLGVKRDLNPERWLAEVVVQWQPDIIHTLGLDPAGYFYFNARKGYDLSGLGKWVLQLRGGSDLTLSRLDPEVSPRISQVLSECDQLLSDNQENYRFALEMGLKKEQIAALGTVPGTGGIDVRSFPHAWHGLPSTRRMILWPKAYECPWSKALPVFDAIKRIWDQIQPCKIYMLAMNSEARMWYWTLPEQIRQNCCIEDRIPRDGVLELMLQARVMLAPSLVDGTPNSMFEAMASGAFPILSPLETIRPLFENEDSVLFARNLYPHEIAEALQRAMTDDALVDRAAARNLEIVSRIADRSKVRPRVIQYYEMLAKERANRDPWCS